MLIKPPFYFANYVDNLGTTVNATTFGTTITAGGSAHTDGSVASLLSALAFDVHYIVIGFEGGGASLNEHNILADLMTDPAGGTSWGEVIADLACGFSPVAAAGSQTMNCYYYFPLYIKAGSTVGMRARSSTASRSFRAAVYAYGNPSRPEVWWCGTKVETLGSTPASSIGTECTNATWTSMGTTTGRWGAMQIGFNGTTGSSNDYGLQWTVGTGSAAIAQAPVYPASIASNEQNRRQLHGPRWCDIPSGTALQLKCDGNTAQTIDAVLYGVY